MSFWFFGCSLNSKREQPIKESEALFNKARKSIRIIAGALDASFYGDERIIGALNNARKRGVSVEIAYCPLGKNHELSELLAEKIPNTKIQRLKEDLPRHWVVVDGKHVRIERKHPQGSDDTPAIICTNARVLGEELYSTFETLEKEVK